MLHNDKEKGQCGAVHSVKDDGLEIEQTGCSPVVLWHSCTLCRGDTLVAHKWWAELQNCQIQTFIEW